MNTPVHTDKPVPALKLAKAVEAVESLDGMLRALHANIFGEPYEGTAEVKQGWEPSLYEAVDCGADRLFEATQRCAETIESLRERLL